MSSSILDNAAVSQALRELSGWQHTGDVIAKTYNYDEPRSAMLFVSRVADAAEAVGHYPDIDIRGSKVVLTIGSHGAGGLTDDDMHLAHRIERLVGEHHHPPGMAGP
jgi:4a-hydroxytetrahydrobiopterin dehydratase